MAILRNGPTLSVSWHYDIDNRIHYDRFDHCQQQASRYHRELYIDIHYLLRYPERSGARSFAKCIRIRHKSTAAKILTLSTAHVTRIFHDEAIARVLLYTALQRDCSFTLDVDGSV